MGFLRVEAVEGRMATTGRRILLAASEVTGFAKTGGLADVAASLPRALAERGHDCLIVLPLYRCARRGRVPLEPTDLTFSVPLHDRHAGGRLYRSTLPESNVPVVLVENSYYFERDDPLWGRGLYGFTNSEGKKVDYPDNCERYVFFCRAVLEVARLLDFRPDVLHANDWQTALLPVYVSEWRHHSHGAEYEWLSRVRSLLTIHNLAYQGVFWKYDLALTGLEWRLFNHRQLEFYDQLNFLKGGVVFADLVNAVSPTYAREIQSPAYGEALDGVLRERRDRLFGIVNGADYREWDPSRDPHLAATYDAATVTDGKPACKAALQRRYGLPEAARTPLLGMVARLVPQKGIDLVLGAADALLAEGVQLVVLGDGDPDYHRQLEDLRRRRPNQVGLYFGFDEGLAHQIEAGADLFLMPSRYEPSGLNQLYSMKYGTPPVVRATGGLADTVVDCTPQTLESGRASGFAFGPYEAGALRDAVRRALRLYHGYPDQWLRLVRTAMAQDWSWGRSAAEYEKLYDRLADGR